MYRNAKTIRQDAPCRRRAPVPLPAPGCGNGERRARSGLGGALSRTSSRVKPRDGRWRQPRTVLRVREALGKLSPTRERWSPARHEMLRNAYATDA
ncbi:hypothetical protein SKAU_G00292860 [Synaphobranchus kaupii]|uniref:Uncharacterized protein n=1 Tax=Synaphobranchus kaupii TaxID=118154 RepID=A0A9Q1EU42_SYNKA|nr:hypothetical protein SKAU_G00292860 [Synaphobranchus kaupii]